jgi:hypothetical protein
MLTPTGRRPWTNLTAAAMIELAGSIMALKLRKLLDLYLVQAMS